MADLVLDATISGATELANKLEKLAPEGGEAGKRIMTDVFRELVQIAHTEALKSAPSVAARSFMTEATSGMAKLKSGLPTAQALTLEYGRKRGAKMPPIDVVEEIQRRNGIGGNPWVIARGIARRGLKGRLFMFYAKKKAQGAAPGLLEKAAKDFEAEFGKTG